jgi:hypothetical protein
MTPDEKAQMAKDLLQIRYEIELLYSKAFTGFVESVHNLSLMVAPVMKQQEALAFKLIELETKLRIILGEEND